MLFAIPFHPINIHFVWPYGQSHNQFWPRIPKNLNTQATGVKAYRDVVLRIVIMESQWTTVGKRSNKVNPAPVMTQKEAAFVDAVRTNEVYSKRQFTEGLTAHRTTEPVYAKGLLPHPRGSGGSVFSSRLRAEVEQARVEPLVVAETRNTVEFQATKPSPYMNAAKKGLEKEKARVANAAIATTATNDSYPGILPMRFNRSRPQTAPLHEEPEHYDEGFDDSDAVVHIRRKRVQPTDKFQPISRVTAIHKSAIDIIEPEDDEPPQQVGQETDYV
jgi:hypothetical protein